MPPTRVTHTPLAHLRWDGGGQTVLLLHGVGAAIGPILAGVLMDVAGPSSLMLFYTAVMAALALYVFKRLKVAAPVPTEDKADFVVMGGGSQAVLLMDPRSEAEDNTASTASTDHPAPR